MGGKVFGGLLAVLGGLLALWLVATVVGFLVKALLWVVVAGLVLAGGAAVVGYLKSGGNHKQLKQ